MTPPIQPTSKPSLTNDHLWMQLQNAVALAAKEDQIAWTIFGIFWAADVLLLGALFVTGRVPERAVGVSVCIAGSVLSLVWYFIQSRALRFLSFYEKVQHALELQLLTGRVDVALSPRLNSTAFDAAQGTSVRARPLMIGSGIGSTVVWFSAGLWFLFKCS